MADLTLDTFAGARGDTFAVAVGEDGATAPLTLTEARAMGGPAHPASGREPFALRFRSESQDALPQGIYAFDHPSLGQSEIFIVPSAIEDGVVVYEAVFN